MTSDLFLRQGRRPRPRPLPSLRPSFSSIGLVILLTFGATACSKGPAVVGTPSTTQATIAFASGSPWSGSLLPVAAPTPINSIVAVTCVTASKCWGVGSTVGSGGAPNGAAVIATVNGGKSWFNQSIPATAGYLAHIACSSQRQCVAVGQGQGNQGVSIITTDGGATWAQSPVPPTISDVTAVSCNSDRRCMGIGTLITGNAALVSTSAGATWNQVGTLSSGAIGASGVSCIDDQHCWVTGHTIVGANQVAGAVVGTSNGGTTWISLPIPVGSGFLNAVSCVQGPADNVGSLPGSHITVPTTPATPTTPTTPTTSLPTVGVAGVRCTVVGTTANTQGVARTGHGLVFTTDNGGGTWASQPIPPSIAGLSSVSCVADYTCVTVGSTITTSPAAGVLLFTGPMAKAWKHATTITSPEPLLGVTCISTSHCVAVGESIIESLTGA